MRVVERLLPRVVVALLAWQVATVAAPLVFAGHLFAEDVCTCPGALPGATCPMHKSHHDPQPASRNPSDCVMRSATTPSTVALLSLSAHIGVMPERYALADVALTRVTGVDHRSVPLGRPDAPEPPPPRS